MQCLYSSEKNLRNDPPKKVQRGLLEDWLKVLIWNFQHKYFMTYTNIPQKFDFIAKFNVRLLCMTTKVDEISVREKFRERCHFLVVFFRGARRKIDPVRIWLNESNWNWRDVERWPWATFRRNKSSSSGASISHSCREQPTLNFAKCYIEFLNPLRARFCLDSKQMQAKLWKARA